MELDILRLLATRASWNSYHKFITSDRLSPEIRDVFKGMSQYYTETGKDKIEWLEFLTWYTVVAHPSLPSDKFTLVELICNKLASATDPINTSVLKNFLIRDYAAKIADTATSVTIDGKLDLMKDVLKTASEFTNSVNAISGSKYYVSRDDWDEQVATLSVGDKYDWALNELQVSIGPIRKGDFIIVGARPDGGKTTFLAYNAAHFAKQLKDGECLLWLNNEEALPKVKSRQAQAALKWTVGEVMKDGTATKAAMIKALGGESKIVTVDKTDMSIQDIDEIVAITNPKIIIIDQIWKVSGFEDSKGTEIMRYGQLAKYIRGMAKDIGPIIGTSQLDGSAEGMKYPDMGTLYGSKTAVQGEADCIIIIGRDPSEPPETRFIHTPKNKMVFGDPTKRNQTWAVGIDSTYAQFVSKIPRPK